MHMKFSRCSERLFFGQVLMVPEGGNFPRAKSTYSVKTPARLHSSRAIF